MAVDYNVHKESKYFFDGINYFCALVTQENGKWKLAQYSSAPVDIIVNDGHGFGTANEKDAATMHDYYDESSNRYGEPMGYIYDEPTIPTYYRCLFRVRSFTL